MRYLHNIVSFLLQGLGFAVEFFFVMIGVMAVWNGYVVEKFEVPAAGILAALVATVVVRLLIWLPVFAKLESNTATIATDVDLGDRPAGIGAIAPPKTLAPIPKPAAPPKTTTPPPTQSAQ